MRSIDRRQSVRAAGSAGLLAAVIALAGCVSGGEAKAVSPPVQESSAAAFSVTQQETVPRDTSPRTDRPAPAPEIPDLPKLVDENEFAIALTITGDSSSAADYRYLVPEDQKTFRKALKAAAEEAVDSVAPQHGNWSICCDGEWWSATWDGGFQQTEREILPRDAAELMALCRGELKKAGIREPVEPGQLKGIQKATFRWLDLATTADPEDLEPLEDLLSAAEPIYPSNCWFNATLTLDLEDGRRETIAMATDSCCIFMSQGSYYQYAGGDNTPFYALFAGKLLHENPGLTGETLEILGAFVDPDVYAEAYGRQEAEQLQKRLYPLGGPVAQTQAQIDQGIRISDCPGVDVRVYCEDRTGQAGDLPASPEPLPVTAAPGEAMLPADACISFPFGQPGENFMLSENVAWRIPDGTCLRILALQETFEPMSNLLELGLYNLDTGVCYGQSITENWAVENVTYSFPDLPAGTYQPYVWNRSPEVLESGMLLLKLLP